MPGRVLYIVSTETYAGKTALCAGLARWLEGTGRRVGYLKPLTLPLPGDDPAAGDDDAMLMRRLLRLDLTLGELAPIWLDLSRARERLVAGSNGDPMAPILAASRRQAMVDVLLVEGANDWQQGSLVGLGAAQVAESLDAQVLIVSRFDGITAADRALAAWAALGSRTIGVVFNGVAPDDSDLIMELVAPALERCGLPVIGSLPSTPSLRAVSVGEISRRLRGRLVVNAEAADNLVEQLMIGAMSAEAALTYFRQLSNKAVVTGGDRTDLQLAALATPTTCLILTGNLFPNRAVIDRARAQSVPIVLVEHDTVGAVREIERLFAEGRFRQPRKIERLMPMLEEQIDLPRLWQLAVARGPARPATRATAAGQD